jgi:hypothetical protein
LVVEWNQLKGGWAGYPRQILPESVRPAVVPTHYTAGVAVATMLSLIALVSGLYDIAIRLALLTAAPAR